MVLYGHVCKVLKCHIGCNVLKGCTGDGLHTIIETVKKFQSQDMRRTQRGNIGKENPMEGQNNYKIISHLERLNRHIVPASNTVLVPNGTLLPM